MSGELVREWVSKAEGDWIALARLQAGPLADVAEVVTFHAQQCAEKYLKALIQREGREPPRIHHLSTLLDMLASLYPDLENLRLPCENLAPYAVLFRYPGEEACEEDAGEALENAGLIRTAIRDKLDVAGR